MFKVNFPDEVLEKFCEKYLYFDFIKLKNELLVFYENSTFQNKNIYEIFQWFSTKFCIDTFNQIYRLSALICTIPATTAAVECTFSALKRIKTYLRLTQSKERLSDLALINIEAKLLKNLRFGHTYHDRVIDKFAEKSRCLELVYK